MKDAEIAPLDPGIDYCFLGIDYCGPRTFWVVVGAEVVVSDESQSQKAE